MWALGIGILLYNYNGDNTNISIPSPDPIIVPINPWWNDNISQKDYDAMRKIIVKNEKKKVSWRFSGWKDSLTIIWDISKLTGINRSSIIISKNDIDSAISTYEWRALSWKSWTIMKSLEDDTVDSTWWKSFMAFVKPSLPWLQSIVKQLGIDTMSTYDDKVRAISLLIQMKDRSMIYSHDTVTYQWRIDTSEYTRPPLLALCDGLQFWWTPNDCDDYATIFIWLALASGVAEEDLYIMMYPRHMSVGVKWLKDYDINNYFPSDNGDIIPIENTTDANRRIIPTTTMWDWTIKYSTDTLYKRALSIGLNDYKNNWKASIIGKNKSRVWTALQHNKIRNT